ncbi:hypothetical protein AMJ47_01985 [Parcubacteria bacterium DG_72]|nr:MAG: hypothetical protein AMJ47_01985 [Parcubacteria bacterium DG_72]
MSELVIFDLDNTLIKEQSQALLLNYARKKRLINPFFYFTIMFWFILYKIGLVKNPKKIMEYSFNFLKDKSPRDFEKIIEDFFRENLKLIIFKEALELVKEHKNKGRKILIVSNAIDYIPQKVGQFLDIDYFIGTRLETKNNKFTGKIEGDIIYGRNKVFAIKRFIRENDLSLKNSWGYSDHYSDIPLLEMTANPVAVNPDKELKKEAIRKTWPILIFKETII